MKCSLPVAALLTTLITATATSAPAQLVTVPQLLQQQDRWEQHARDQKRFLIEGRFQSRVTESFGLEKLDLIFRHPNTVRLPDRVRRGQTLEVSGSFMLDGSRLHFHVNRVQVREMDDEQLRRRAEESRSLPWDELLKLADEYSDKASFYNDDVLRQEITAVRSAALNIRKQQLRGQPTPLSELLQIARQLQLTNTAIQGITWEWLIAASAASEDPTPLATAAKTLNGWDQKNSAPPKSLLDAFQKNPSRAWEDASEPQRQLLHRLLYSSLQLASLRKQLRPDGSNGTAVAQLVREQLPEAAAAANDLENLEVKWYLNNAQTLDRQQLMESSRILQGLNRQQDALKLRNRWLQAQQERFGTNTLAGILRTAEETLFAAEQWRDLSLREQAVTLLKHAWDKAASESPADVSAIADRLKSLGWEHFRGSWMTREQIASIPGNDIQLAAREGRVVTGMTAEQATQILGQPTRIARLGGSTLLRELWVYQDAGLIIRLRRNLRQPASDLLVEDVARLQ